MMYFLDTDICIFALQGRYPPLQSKIMSLEPDRVKIPSIVKAELLLGACKPKDSKRVLDIVEKFLAPFEIIPFCDQCAVTYAQIRFDLEEKGAGIGPNDLLIASTVLAHHGTLVTHNLKEYKRLPQLKLQDWTQ